MKKAIFAGLLIVVLTTGHGYAMMDCGMMGGHGSHADHGGDAAAEEHGAGAAHSHQDHLSQDGTGQGLSTPDSGSPENSPHGGDYPEENPANAKAHSH
ncbi:MAG: hypothetical protein M0Z79_07050 [Nitrospiraceae bacterium]|nr:hypothetical protein [Nitrospiraceae bacterium]